jgi:hypothetical protein
MAKGDLLCECKDGLIFETHPVQLACEKAKENKSLRAVSMEAEGSLSTCSGQLCIEQE